MIEFAAGFSVGLAVGYLARGGEPVAGRGLRLVSRHAYVPRATIAKAVDRTQWDIALVTFAFECTRLDSISEKAVVEAGVVTSVNHYRMFSKLLRACEVWVWRGERAGKQWATSNKARAVGDLHDLLLRDVIAPDYPSPTPPMVYRVSQHASEIADTAD